jgi:hypothetical protein
VISADGGRGGRSGGLAASPVFGPGAPKLRTRPRGWAISDQAEPWDVPVARRDRNKVIRMLPGRPFRPTKPDEVPPPAMAALHSACGALPLDRLYVVPRTVRLVDSSTCVLTPTRVLGFGDGSVGLWTEGGPDGWLTSMPIDGLLAIDDRAILLYGRLRLIGPEGQIVVRYNTVTRNDLLPNLLRLRAAAATAAGPVAPRFLWLDPSGDSKSPAELPHKWRILLDNPAVRPDPSEPVVVAAGDLTEIESGRTGPPSGVAVLGQRELVIANEPIEYLDSVRYGVDLLAVPRQRLGTLSWDGQALTVTVVGGGLSGGPAPAVTLPLDAFLVEAMWRAFGDAVRWA